MKTFVVGDTHLVQSEICPIIDENIEKYSPDRIVFTGDYTDQFGADDNRYRNEINYFKDRVYKWRLGGLVVDLVMGNHDFYYFSGKKMHFSAAPDDVIEVLKNDLRPVMATKVGKFVVSHAGLTKSWLKHNFGDTSKSSTKVMVNKLNRKFDNLLKEDSLHDEDYMKHILWQTDWHTHGFNSIGRARGGHGLPSCLWADLSELIQDYPIGAKYSQIVGHTPIREIGRYITGESEVYFIDTFSIDSNNNKYGDGSFLLVNEVNSSVEIIKTNWSETN